MRMSALFTKTLKEVPQDIESLNARFLIRGGFVDQHMAGVYSYLPLGLRVLQKIQRIVREEMNAIGGQEILMPALLSAEPWKVSGRWDDPGTEVMFQFKGAGDRDVGLGWTHEEIVTPLVQKFVSSYQDLPIFVYQIQDKFRNELRAKSGILRGREFNMKDLYSFHATEEELEAYYDKVLEAYLRVFRRCGIDAIPTEASGGAFSKVSHEFQMPTESGEDTIYVNGSGDYAWNKEIYPDMKDGDEAPDGSGPVKEMRAIEVGNIFKLKTRFTDPFKMVYTDEEGKQRPVQMGCYGIGPSRVMGSIVESHNDERGIVWPKAIAPFHVHLISLGAKDEGMQEEIRTASESMYEDAKREGIDVLWDDRMGVTAGAKFADADLIGIPLRIVVSEKTLAESSAEWKRRSSDEAHFVALDGLLEELIAEVNED
ncbi:MAG: aminoacyl--tRNA ligase-related protein [Patescibacteria group bacterium]